MLVRWELESVSFFFFLRAALCFPFGLEEKVIEIKYSNLLLPTMRIADVKISADPPHPLTRPPFMPAFSLLDIIRLNLFDFMI